MLSCHDRSTWTVGDLDLDSLFLAHIARILHEGSPAQKDMLLRTWLTAKLKEDGKQEVDEERAAIRRELQEVTTELRAHAQAQ
jgi:hypothetical protein